MSRNSPPPDTRPQTPAGASSGNQVVSWPRIYSTQAIAFIQAAEVVDADPDIIADILEGFDAEEVAIEDDSNENTPEPEMELQYVNSGNAPKRIRGPDLDVLNEAKTTWSKAEIKEMMTDLKEKGRGYFVQEYAINRAIPIPKLLYAFGIYLCKELREKQFRTLRYFLEVAMTLELQNREKLPQYNTIDDVVKLIQQSKRIMILTGAGISVSCGIPDFRSRDGLYATLQNSGEYNLDDPQQMFDIHFFRENPTVFYSFASKIYPSNFIPSPCHRFIKLVENKGKLLRNYTQNIDTLERLAGVQRVIQCHGSFATASCINCKRCVPGNAIEKEIMSHEVPLCPVCNPEEPPPSKDRGKAKTKTKRKSHPWEDEDEDEPDAPLFPAGIMKPDITFFGEKLADEYDRALNEDRPQVDLLLVIGTSLKVTPVSEILTHLRHSVPQILINKTPVKHATPDVMLLGNADDIVQYLCRKLGWDLPEHTTSSNSQHLRVPDRHSRKRLSEEVESREPQRVGNSHVWLFEGAEGGKYVEDIQKQYLRSKQSNPVDLTSVNNKLQDSSGDHSRTGKKLRTV